MQGQGQRGVPGGSTATRRSPAARDLQVGALQPSRAVEVRKTASSVFELSLCLSRACLGKMFVLIYKWLKNAVFSQASDHYPSRISSDTSILDLVLYLVAHTHVNVVCTLTALLCVL